jgi:hypothetical protein
MRCGKQPVMLNSMRNMLTLALAAACRGCHIGSLQELPHTICDVVGPFCSLFTTRGSFQGFYTSPSQGWSHHGDLNGRQEFY